MAKRPTKEEARETPREETVTEDSTVEQEAQDAADTRDNTDDTDEPEDLNDWNDVGGDIKGEASDEDRAAVNTDDPEPNEDDGADALTEGQGSSDGVVRVAVVDEPSNGDGFSAGEALTPEQKAGLEPMDREHDNEQAANRDHLTNRQTDHEAENALDPVSSSPNTGVTPQAPLTAVATGAPVSDMSGRPALSPDDQTALTRAREALSEARSRDTDNDEKEERRGWRTPQEIGVSGGVMARLQSIYPERIEVETVPNGHFFPETGKRYRLA